MSETPTGPTYTEAATELEQILRELESGRLDVDEVVAKVRRASELITLCREKVRAASIQVHEILAETASN